jgi:hypothetical protein
MSQNHKSIWIHSLAPEAALAPLVRGVGRRRQAMHDPGHSRTAQVAARGLMSDDDDSIAARQCQRGVRFVHDCLPAL